MPEIPELPAGEPGPWTARRAPEELGHLIVGLMVLVTVMLIMMTVAGQSWTFLMRRDAEAELIFRGEQYARAIEFYRKELNSYPLELKTLMEKGPHRHRYIRRLWKDPVAKDGKWGHLYLSPTGQGYVNPHATRRGVGREFAAGGLGDEGGEEAPEGRLPGRPSRFGSQRSGRGGRSLFDRQNEEQEEKSGYSALSQQEFTARAGEMAGMPIVGVVHRHKESGLKIYKNYANLNDWAFTVLAEGEQVGPVGGGAARVTPQRVQGVGDVQSPIFTPSMRQRQQEQQGLGRRGPSNPARDFQERRRREQQQEEERRRRQGGEDDQAGDEEGEQDEEEPRYREEEPAPEEEPVDEDQDEEEAPDPNAPRDPNAPADPNAPSDPNAPADPNS